ncbi:MAG: 4-(cytidine 5'-diphospho)-2-C-methyl-D-erythritol kinase [Stappiaceae bacterium]
MPLTLLAKAKVNLALHVTGQREDGYHLLDTLVAFPDIGDQILVSPSDRLMLTLDGPFAEELSASGGGEENIALQAAKLLCGERSGPSRNCSIKLTKNLPVASGIGGGSADAAATLKALNAYWQLRLSDTELIEYATRLGADVPMCVYQCPLRAQGIGDDISTQSPFPPCGIILINPRIPVSTPDVFKKLIHKNSPPLPEIPRRWKSLDHLVEWLCQTRNDLEASARLIAPQITDAIGWLDAQDGCRFARMSGSGATCFALFENEEQAKNIARTMRFERPDCWVGAGAI